MLAGTSLEECAASSAEKPQIQEQTPHWICPPAVLDGPKVLLKSAKLHHGHKLGSAEIYGQSPTAANGPRLSRRVSVVAFTKSKLRHFQPQ